MISDKYLENLSKEEILSLDSTKNVKTLEDFANLKIGQLIDLYFSGSSETNTGIFIGFTKPKYEVLWGYYWGGGFTASPRVINTKKDQEWTFRPIDSSFEKFTGYGLQSFSPRDEDYEEIVSFLKKREKRIKQIYREKLG